ncbi:MAG: glycerophosphodiester phosphodiesterase family protein [Balneola sp.]
MKKKILILSLVIFIALLYLNNTTHLAEPIRSEAVLLAHRGLAQDFNREGLTHETCTAARMVSTGHSFLENTIPSMRQAFELGADVVEFDIHKTIDNRFAVFHDWTLDCRTEASGITHTFTLDSLKQLDIGYGYTADGGQTYPFRGTGIGMIPSLEAVLDSFPGKEFLIDIKSQIPSHGALLADHLAELPEKRQKQIMVYGGGNAVSEIREQLPNVQTIWPRRLKQCLIKYAVLGWTGYVPASCERSVITVPANYAHWLWGWPSRFLQRMETAGSRVFVIGDYHSEGHSTGFDDPDRLSELSENYSGGIWTDRIDLIGPTVKNYAR